MKTQTWKVVMILAVTLIFVAGIIGMPKEWSKSGILASIGNQIHLGLDLKGGTHLIRQVQVNDAVNVDSDNVIARLKEDMRARKVSYAEIFKSDQANRPDLAAVKGVPPEQSTDLRSIVSE